MKKKNVTKKSIGAVVFASALTMSMGMPAFAAGNYDATIGGEKTTTFDKYLVMDAQAEVPNASFTYAVTAGTAKVYNVADKKFEILAGVNADKVTMAGVGSKTANTIAYSQGDATSNDENALVKGYDKTTEKYAKKTATLDFSACNFTEPGIYRYIVTESGTNQAVTNDEDATRVVDVYVNDDSGADGKKLTIAGYVLHSNESDIKAGDDLGSTNANPDGKSQGFTNKYDTSDLTFKKEVSGNQASHDKYFKFTVTIKDAVPGTVYNVNRLNAEETSKSNAATITENAGKTNPDKLTVGTDGTVTKEFYLQHGQEITIQGIAKDSHYSVTEKAEDYKSTAAGVADYKDPVEGTIESADLKTSYLNTRKGVIPTGVIMTVAPFAAVTLLGGAGVVTMVMKKKKSSEEE